VSGPVRRVLWKRCYRLRLRRSDVFFVTRVAALLDAFFADFFGAIFFSAILFTPPRPDGAYLWGYSDPQRTSRL
jgi:hypothetical protein